VRSAELVWVAQPIACCREIGGISRLSSHGSRPSSPDCAKESGIRVKAAKMGPTATAVSHIEGSSINFWRRIYLNGF
jgi:hypothetical protein